MVIVSGFVEANSIDDVQNVSEEIKKKNISVTDTKEEKVVFLIEKEDIAQVKLDLDSINDLDGVRSVYLAYYSIDGDVDENEFKEYPKGNA